MLENLSTRLQGIFSGLRGKGRLTEDDISITRMPFGSPIASTIDDA